MKRRALLAGSGAALSALLAGCRGDGVGLGATTTRRPDCDVSLNDAGPDADRLVEAWSRNDVPPYETERPDGDSSETWNAEYLGRNMPTTPSLGFTSAPLPSDNLPESTSLSPGQDSYLVKLIDTEEKADRLLSGGTTDFEESVLVLVGDCCGSSSVEHRWARVEETTAGIHLYGYLTQPYRRTADLAPRYSLLEVERPADAVDLACASLTVETHSRIHADSADGVVSLVPGVIGNDGDPVPVRLHIGTKSGAQRVDETVSLEGDMEHWRAIGTVAETSETLVVSVESEALGADVTEEFTPDGSALGVRVREGGEVVVGPSDEIR